MALPSKGKSSKALKVIESEEESPDGDSDEDPTEKMVMLSNKLEYLARKNRKFLRIHSSTSHHILRIKSLEIMIVLEKQDHISDKKSL